MAGRQLPAKHTPRSTSPPATESLARLAGQTLRALARHDVCVSVGRRRAASLRERSRVPRWANEGCGTRWTCRTHTNAWQWRKHGRESNQWAPAAMARLAQQRSYVEGAQNSLKLACGVRKRIEEVEECAGHLEMPKRDAQSLLVPVESCSAVNRPRSSRERLNHRGDRRS